MHLPLTQYWQVLAEHLAPQWRKVALLAALLLATTGLQLLTPQLLRRFIDTALASAVGNATPDEADPATRVLFTTALLFLATGLANQLLSAAATYVSNDVGWLATNRLRAKLALHCLGLDLAFHNARTPGELIERIDGDVNALATFFSSFAVRVLGSVLLVVGVLVALARENALVGAALAVFAAAAFFALARTRSLAVPAAAAEREASAQLYGFLEERLSGIDDVRANGAGAYVMRRFHERMGALFHRGRRAWMMRALLWTLTMQVFGLGNVLTLALGAVLFQRGVISIGTVYLFSRYVDMLLEPIERLVNQLQDLQQASAGIARIQELYEIEPAICDGDGAAALPHGALALEFDRVTFAYLEAAGAGAGERRTKNKERRTDAMGRDSSFVEPALSEARGSLPQGSSANAVLQDVTFSLAPGAVLGLLGRTGSGKSTIGRLLFRFYDPMDGAIRLGGKDLRELGVGHLRERVALVTQDVQLFHGSVRDNLTLFDPSVDDAAIQRVLDELGLAAWYAALPEGLDTPLGPGGHGLSAGEAQLLAFTRAFLGDPSLVILDEASSRLDLATEQLIERAVDRLLRGRTGIVIAHRLATVRRADDILILEDGRVSEYGARRALAADQSSRFAALLRTGLETGAMAVARQEVPA